jgi:hypothetical protein
MNDQITNFFNRFDLLYPSQYGFRGNYSTELAAIELSEKIQSAMDNNELAINIFLDLSKAFDTLDHETLLYKLKYYGFSENALVLMKSYLLNRKQFVEFKECQSNLLTIKTGVPQGSILGPLLFIIYVNDLVNSSEIFSPIMYADDTTLAATLNVFENSECPLAENINNELNKVSTWLKLNKLSLNCEKTKCMVFHTPGRQLQYPSLFMNDCSIEIVNEFNFLGIVFDKSLTWKCHVNAVCKKVSKAIGILNKLKNYLPSHALKTIHNSLVLPHFNYGLLLWGSRSNKVFPIQKKSHTHSNKQ